MFSWNKLLRFPGLSPFKSDKHTRPILTDCLLADDTPGFFNSWGPSGGGAALPHGCLTWLISAPAFREGMIHNLSLAFWTYTCCQWTWKQDWIPKYIQNSKSPTLNWKHRKENSNYLKCVNVMKWSTFLICTCRDQPFPLCFFCFCSLNLSSGSSFRSTMYRFLAST